MKGFIDRIPRKNQLDVNIENNLSGFCYVADILHFINSACRFCGKYSYTGKYYTYIYTTIYFKGPCSSFQIRDLVISGMLL